jgi:hypothetical protein
LTGGKHRIHGFSLGGRLPFLDRLRLLVDHHGIAFGIRADGYAASRRRPLVGRAWAGRLRPCDRPRLLGGTLGLCGFLDLPGLSRQSLLPGLLGGGRLRTGTRLATLMLRSLFVGGLLARKEFDHSSDEPEEPHHDQDDDVAPVLGSVPLPQANELFGQYVHRRSAQSKRPRCHG